MEQVVKIEDFMGYLADNDLVITPRDLVEKALAERELENKAKALMGKSMLTFKEISDGKFWGEITTRAVKNYALKYAKEGEVILRPSGKMKKYKMVRSAVLRLAKQRGYGE